MKKAVKPKESSFFDKFKTIHTIEKTLKSHLVEWGATALSVSGAVLNANKWIGGFYLWSIANVLWILFGLKYKHYGLVVMNIVFLCINIYGIINWWGEPFNSPAW